MKQKPFLFLAALLLASCGAEIPTIPTNSVPEGPFYCSFLKNFNKEQLSLESGFLAVGNSLVHETVEIVPGQAIAIPESNPIRSSYQFAGWCVDAACEQAYDFSLAAPSHSMYLYAKWEKAAGEEFVEPEYIVPSHIDDSIAGNYVLEGVLNEPLRQDGNISLTTAGIKQLQKHAENLEPLLNYKAKSGIKIEGTYVGNNINLTINGNGVNESKSIYVYDVTTSLKVNNDTYENKAVAYENKSEAIDAHHIMLAGSSSMENWSTSTEDLLPLVSYNHGIGGTTVQQWRDSLNARLVYPHSPKTVVYYVGINNVINSKEDEAMISKALVEMFDDVHAHLPDTKIYYVLMNHVPGYLSYVNVIDAANAKVKEYEATHSFLTAIDPGATLLKANGEPNSAYFLTDGLHMSKYGYTLWGGAIKAKLIADMKNA